VKLTSPPLLLAGAVVLGSLALAACSSAGGSGTSEISAPADSYDVERSQQGGVETVRTVSGSLWGATATLVEELSVGEETGDDTYLFGSISAAWATDDRLYVVDSQVPAVRAFDSTGKHLFDVGSPGQGPGEYLMPTAVLVRADGSIAVAEAMSARINFYDSEGLFLDNWSLASQKSALGLTLAPDGQLYTQSWSLDEERMGLQRVGSEGLTGEILFPPHIDSAPVTVPVGKGLEMILPFSPTYAWAFAPSGEMIAGAGDPYRFEIHRPDGSVTAVERSVSPIAVDAEEADFRARLASSSLRLMVPDSGVGRGDIPTHKPAFKSFYPDLSGRIWVVREGPGRPDPECMEADLYMAPRLLMKQLSGTTFETGGKPGPWDAEALRGRCWTDTYVFDLFDISTGDFLGSLDAPEDGFKIPLFAEDDTVLAAVADDLGTIRLKKYKLKVN